MPYLSHTTHLITSSHEFYRDHSVVIGFFRYPTAAGQAIAILNQDTDLFSVPLDEFTNILGKLSTTAIALSKVYDVKRCALVTEGARLSFIIPLHGLCNTWNQVTSDLKEFHEYFPGYISSKDGPKLSTEILDGICSKIRAVSGLSEPFNRCFHGDANDANIFARIVRGHVQQWRVWEDDDHVAFLTPFANTYGFTVLVPRQHLSSDVFSIKGETFSKLMKATDTMGRLLKKAFDISQCGLIMEGFEIDYAHVKLIPILKKDIPDEDPSSRSVVLKEAPFHDTYQGYVTSLWGPLDKNSAVLTKAAQDMRKLLS